MRAMKHTLDPRGMFAPGNVISDGTMTREIRDASSSTSTRRLSGIEGIDWLAERRGPERGGEDRALTDERCAA